MEPGTSRKPHQNSELSFSVFCFEFFIFLVVSVREAVLGKSSRGLFSFLMDPGIHRYFRWILDSDGFFFVSVPKNLMLDSKIF